MRTCILLLICISLLYPGCLNMDTNCCDHYDTYKVSNGLYVEKFRTFCAGVFGERIDHFLTDSVKFRVNVGWNDEHNFLWISQVGDSVFTYKVESSLLEDTLKREFISKKELIKFNDMKSPTKVLIPLFEIHPLQCNNSYFFSSYKVSNGYFLVTNQFKCDNTFINASYLTDSSSFRVLIGFYDVGRGPFYSVSVKDDMIYFYETQHRNKLDTVEIKGFKLSELKKEGFEKPCKK